jgi:purine-nucleoside/S-methyl-5'-thioadenosine phosphorylase / adenosine deaminase
VIGQSTIEIEEPLLSSVPLPIVQSRLLSAIPQIAHGVTRRVVGLKPAEGNVGYGAPRDLDDAWKMRSLWCDAVGLDAATIVTVHQVHGSEVVVAMQSDAGRGAIPGSKPLAQADAIISNEPGVTLMTLHADCLALFLCDPVIPAVAAIHAGWRGTIVGVTARTVEAMVASFGAQPDRIIAHLGPTNRACCFEVGDEVIDGWLTVDPTDQARSVTRPGPRAHFDVAAANRWQLLQSGVQPANIEMSGICTSCSSEQWFSHRVQGPDTGRFGAIIGIR